MTTRTEELAAAGAVRRGLPAAETDSGGERTPFIDWPPEGPAWIEGELVEVWEGTWGDNATLTITGVSGGLSPRDGQPFKIGERVNVGLSPAALKDTVSKDQIGGPPLHFAFLGWAESGAGNKYRRFMVLEVPGAVAEAKPPQVEAKPAEENNDDDLPF